MLLSIRRTSIHSRPSGLNPDEGLTDCSGFYTEFPDTPHAVSKVAQQGLRFLHSLVTHPPHPRPLCSDDGRLSDWNDITLWLDLHVPCDQASQVEYHFKSSVIISQGTVPFW